MRLQGADEIARLLRALPGQLRQQVVNASLRAASRRMLQDAKMRAPFSGARNTMKYWRGGRADYGHLRDNLRALTLRPGKGTVADATVLITTGDAFWGLFVELGRKGRPMRTTSFLGAAFNANAASFVDLFGKEVSKRLEKLAENLAGKFSTSKWRK
jgi:hypothetical protein